MEAGIGALGFFMTFGLVGLAGVAVLLHLEDASAAPANRLARRPRPIDAEPHTLTMLGRNGRPNPAAYELHPDLDAALARQRELARKGRDCLISHTATGELRIDLNDVLGPWRGIRF